MVAGLLVEALQVVLVPVEVGGVQTVGAEVNEVPQAEQLAVLLQHLLLLHADLAALLQLLKSRGTLQSDQNQTARRETDE